MPFPAAQLTEDEEWEWWQPINEAELHDYQLLQEQLNNFNDQCRRNESC